MEMSEAIKKMKESKVNRVFIQLPEGLRAKSLEIADLLERNGFIPIICLENTFGACDLRDDEALKLECDAILHIGHNDFGFEWLKSKLPVFYVEWFSEKEGIENFKKILETFKDFKKVGIVYSIQYKKCFEKIVELLKNSGKEIFVNGNGQIIGCNYSNATIFENKVDAFLVISSGKFHALGLALKTNKPVFVFDVELNDVFRVEAKRYLKLIEWNKKVFEESKNVGLLVSWKKGQLKDFKNVKERIEKLGKRVYVLAFDELSESLLEGLKLDCLVNLACPRISVDDLDRYKIPIVDVSILTSYT